MRSDKQKETSRRNGAKSRGPATDAGKQRSSQNAAKHHITSKALLIPGESEKELDAHFAAYRDRFRPADPIESDLVHNLAFIAWRQHRLWKREADLIAIAVHRNEEMFPGETPFEWAASDAWRSLAHGPSIALLHREEAGLRRAFDRTLKTLIQLQGTRPEPPPPDDDAKLQNEPEPVLNGSVTNVIQVGPAPQKPASEVSENGIGTVLTAPASPSAAAAPAAVHFPTVLH